MSFAAQKTHTDKLPPEPSLQHAPLADHTPLIGTPGFTNPTALADAAGERGNRFMRLAPVTGIDPVDGWVLMTDRPDRILNYQRADFFARGPEEDVLVDVSPFHANFAWTQARFAWFVRNGFPARPGIAPWSDKQVDAMIARSFVRGEA